LCKDIFATYLNTTLKTAIVSIQTKTWFVYVTFVLVAGRILLNIGVRRGGAIWDICPLSGFFKIFLKVVGIKNT